MSQDRPERVGGPALFPLNHGERPRRRLLARAVALWLLVAAGVPGALAGEGTTGADTPQAAGSRAEACLQTKGWEVLPDPSRLCYHLSDPGDVARCEARGYRMGRQSEPWPSLLAEAAQYLLLCGDEYVIEVEADTVSCPEGCPPLADGERYNALRIRTAILETEGELAGEYVGGNIHVLVRDAGGWRDRWLEDRRGWSEYSAE